MERSWRKTKLEVFRLAWRESTLCQSSVMCHVFPPHVSIFGLFPVLVSCHYELICVQLCVCDYVLITLCI